ncbi:MAG: VWA domain-containing protein [Acidobacteriales bacterium]|nr:MAG: VWA domain-containing protein [Terriglobales bacterium]
MHHLNKIFLALALTPAFIPSAGRGQDPLFKAESHLVVLHASVADRSGKLITNLPREAFKVYENNVEQEIKIFRREDIPVSLGIVVDNSGSMRPRRLQVEAAALQLVKASHPEDQVFIVNFNDEAYLDCPFTNSIAKLEEGLARIDSRGGTAMRDAISMSIDYIKEDGKLDKKVILAITDGNDNMSSITLEELVRKAQQSEVLIYAIGLPDEEMRREARNAKRALDSIASSSGGLDYFPKELPEVERIALQVAHEIRNQYVIAYTPSNPSLDGSYRQIRIAVDGPNRPVARTRTGYYATPEARQKARASLPAGTP